MTIHRFARPSTIVAAAAVLCIAIAALVAIRAETGGAGAPRPGLTAGVSALDRLPPAAGVPKRVIDVLTVLPPTVVDDPAAVAHRIRRLRSDVGRGRSGLYAFRSKSGSVCFIVEQHSAACPDTLSVGEPGFLWSIGGGTEQVPPALVGVVADNVASISLAIDGIERTVAIKNNAVFAELPQGAKVATVTISYSDGAEPQQTIVNLQV